MPRGGWRAGILAAAYLALLASLAAGSANVSEGAPAEPRIGVYVEVEAPAPTVHEWSDAVLSRGISDGRVLGGLALLDLTLRTEYDMTLVSYSSGESLFWISGIHLSLAYRSPEVYVAGRYRKGSCEFRAVLEHEDEHVRADHEVVKGVAGKLESALRSADWPTYGKPRHLNTLEEGKAETAARVGALIAPLLEELKERRQQARQAVDSTASFQRAQQRCAMH